jgi:hypothetical protein
MANVRVGTIGARPQKRAAADQDLTGAEWESVDHDVVSVGSFGKAGQPVPFWGDNPAAWERIVLDGYRVPGVAKVGGKAFEVKADKKKAPGESGASTTVLGRNPCEPEITVQLWTAKHLSDFCQVIASFLPKNRTALPYAVDVFHPALVMYRIRSIYIMSSSYPEERTPGVYEVKLKFLEAFKGGGSKPKAAGPKLSDLGKGEVPAEVARKEARLTPGQASVTPAQTNGTAPRLRGGTRGGATVDF